MSWDFSLSLRGCKNTYGRIKTHKQANKYISWSEATVSLSPEVASEKQIVQWTFAASSTE